MKKHNAIVALMVAAVFFACSAEVRLGLNVRNHAQSDNGLFSLEMGPVLGIMLGDVVELAPEIAGVYYHIDHGNNPDENYGGFLAACGLLFHAVNTERFSLSLGPHIYVRPLFSESFSTGAAMPVNCDLLVGSRWIVRLGIWVAHVNFWDNGPNDNTTWDLQTIAAPSFTLFFAL